MEYNDELHPTPDEYEKLARAYSASLKDKGFVFIRLDMEDYNFLLDEIFDIMFKLRASYRALNKFLESDRFNDLNEEQIAKLRELFDYKKNRGFRIRSDKTKTLLNCISLESKLIMKLNQLAQKCDYFEEISKLCAERLRLSAEIYQIEGLFLPDDKFIR